MNMPKSTGQPRCCITCGSEFTDVKVIPDLVKDPRGWFTICDADFGGSLDREEVMDALGTVLPIERQKLEKAIKNHWHEWDPDGDGSISLQEFLSPNRGLKEYIMKHLGELKKDSVKARPDEVPNLDTHPREWFEYWDKDGSGTLERDEAIRAMIKSFCLTTWGEPVLQMAHDMREVAVNLWTELGYHEFDSVNFDEFIKPYGFADTFVHNQ